MDLRDEDLTQNIRLLDIFGVGPLMIYAGMKTEDELPHWVRGALVLFGITTIGYNGMNYLSVREEGELRGEMEEEYRRRVESGEESDDA